MKNDLNRSNETDVAAPLSGPAAHSISAIVAAEGIKPVDFAVEELRRAGDRDAWLERAVVKVVGSASPRRLVAEVASRDELDRMRHAATMAFGGATKVEERNAALVAYAFVVAAGLVHHGVLLSSQPRAEIDVMLAELAGVLGEPFASFLEAAVAREVRA